MPSGLESERRKKGSLTETPENRIVKTKKHDEIKELQKYF